MGVSILGGALWVRGELAALRTALEALQKALEGPDGTVAKAAIIPSLERRIERLESNSLNGGYHAVEVREE